MTSPEAFKNVRKRAADSDDECEVKYRKLSHDDNDSLLLTSNIISDTPLIGVDENIKGDEILTQSANEATSVDSNHAENGEEFCKVLQKNTSASNGLSAIPCDSSNEVNNSNDQIKTTLQNEVQISAIDLNIKCPDQQNSQTSNVHVENYIITKHNSTSSDLCELSIEDSQLSKQVEQKLHGEPGTVCSEQSDHIRQETLENTPNIALLSGNIVVKCEEVEKSADTKYQVDENKFQEGSATHSSVDTIQSRPSTSAATSNDVIVPSDLSDKEVEEIIEGLSGEINVMLEHTAEKNCLTAKNVQCILRHVITNQYVLAMVRNTMRAEHNEDDELEEAVYEPKLTRSKAKELRQKQATLPWPVASPGKEKQASVSKQLLEGEFSEDEGSSDEEYKPVEVDETHTDDEEEHASSNKGSPIGSPSAKDSLSTSLEESLCDDLESSIAPLVIEEAPQVTIPNESQQEADQIALRTRSKLPLVDTPMETIEASFIAPDITEDMYEAVCDDEEWKTFLSDIFKPLDRIIMAEQQDDDAEDDPEYNILEDHDDAHDQWERKTAKISQKELDALFAEILEIADQELDEIDDEKEDTATEKMDNSDVCILHDDDDTIITMPQLPPTKFSSFEILQLQEQMRMHVQLLLQSFLLSHGHEEFIDHCEQVTACLDTLQTTFANTDSIVRPHNLDEALSIVKRYEVQGITSPVSAPKQRRKYYIRKKVKELIAHSKAFIYPDILPHNGYCHSISYRNSKSIFVTAEDCLIAMGLEEFTELGDPVHWINKLLVPAKTESQIKNRIKNSRGTPFKDNPLQYYLKHQVMPPISRCLRPFNPSNMKAPCELSGDVVPKWMIPFLVNPIRIAPQKKVAIVHPLLKQPDRSKYRCILPRSYISPIKRITPILKKYVQHRRIVPIAPFNIVTAPLKPMGLLTRKTHGVIPIKPKPDPKAFQNSSVKIAVLSDSSVESTARSPTVSTAGVSKLHSIVTVSQPAHKDIDLTCSSDDNTEIDCLSVCSPESIVETALKVADVPASKLPCGIVNRSELDSNSESTSDYTDTVDHCNTGCDIRTENETSGDPEICEDGEEEAVDDEQDLAALMAASSTICKKHSTAKKKNKHQRDLESTLPLLAPDLLESDPKKDEREKAFAQSYLLRVMEALKDSPEKCEEFLKMIISYENNTKTPIQLYEEIQTILNGHADLINDFTAFLLPDQANECGKYMEYTMFNKIKTFLRKVEVHFSQQPHHIQRIVRTLTQLQSQPNITSSAIISAMQPLLRNQSHLLEEFSQLLPDEAPPECLMTDFEEINIPNSDGENSSCDSVEEIVIPETNDPYGGKDCPCTCHSATSDARMLNKNRHCVKCGTKFLDGKIYIQTGKVLKPAQVVYHTLNTNVQGKPNDAIQCSKSDLESCGEKSKNITVSLQDDEKVSHTGKQALDSQNEERRGILNISNVIAKHFQEETITKGSQHHSDILHFALVENFGSKNYVPLLPCDVVEDAVLTPDPRDSLSSIPSDFSRLRDVISLGMLSNTKSKSPKKCEGEFLYSQPRETIETTQSVLNDKKSSVTSNDIPQMFFQVGSQNITNCLDSIQINSLSFPSSSTGPSWSREQDKMILETCTRLQGTDESFAIAAKAIRSKNVHEVQLRFHELLKMFEKRLEHAPEQ